MTSTATQPARLLEWDSTFFARRIASVGSAPLSSEDVVGVVDWCRSERIECLYVLSDAEHVASMHALEEAGGRIMDVRVTFERKLEKNTGPAPATVRGSLPSDIPVLRAIAAKSHGNSRFYADPHFPRARCDELYATWIEKSCRGWADRVFVAEIAGETVGYMTCHVRDGDRGELGIAGVTASAQGHGLGRDLVGAALHWLAERGIPRVTVATQGRNIVAQRLYQSFGFRTSTMQVWHHVWFDVEGNGA